MDRAEGGGPIDDVPTAVRAHVSSNSRGECEFVGAADIVKHQEQNPRNTRKIEPEG
jgi:hypothetical protein